MVYIPSGEFFMGSTEADWQRAYEEAKSKMPDVNKELFSSESPQHKVIISKGFYIGKYEVTQEQWRAVMGKGWEVNHRNCDNCPVEQVSLGDVDKFCQKLSQMTGNKYRLPTEAEWEYAARAGTTGDYAGDLEAMAWYYDNSGDQRLNGKWSKESLDKNNNQTHPVGQKQPNAWGLYDMHGNVWEWCADWYKPYEQETTVDQQIASINRHDKRWVSRGGGWALPGIYCRSAARQPSTRGLTGRSRSIGFRLVMIQD